VTGVQTCALPISVYNAKHRVGAAKVEPDDVGLQILFVHLLYIFKLVISGFVISVAILRGGTTLPERRRHGQCCKDNKTFEISPTIQVFFYALPSTFL
jgi:hypothetical protein